MLEWIDGGNGEWFTVLGNDGNYKSLKVTPLRGAGVYLAYVNGKLRGHFNTRASAMRHAEDIAAMRFCSSSGSARLDTNPG